MENDNSDTSLLRQRGRSSNRPRLPRINPLQPPEQGENAHATGSFFKEPLLRSSHEPVGHSDTSSRSNEPGRGSGWYPPTHQGTHSVLPTTSQEGVGTRYEMQEMRAVDQMREGPGMSASASDERQYQHTASGHGSTSIARATAPLPHVPREISSVQDGPVDRTQFYSMPRQKSTADEAVMALDVLGQSQPPTRGGGPRHSRKRSSSHDLGPVRTGKQLPYGDSPSTLPTVTSEHPPRMIRSRARPPIHSEGKQSDAKQGKLLQRRREQSFAVSLSRSLGPLPGEGNNVTRPTLQLTRLASSPNMVPPPRKENGLSRHTTLGTGAAVGGEDTLPNTKSMIELGSSGPSLKRMDSKIEDTADLRDFMLADKPVHYSFVETDADQIINEYNELMIDDHGPDDYFRRLSRMENTRRRLCNAAFVVALWCILFVVIELEVLHSNDLRSSQGTNAVKVVLTISSLVQAFLSAWYYHAMVTIKKLRNELPSDATLIRPDIGPWLVLEVILSLVHPLPFYEHIWSFDLGPSYEPIVVHSDYIGLVVFVRVYLAVRVVIFHSRLHGTKAKFISALNKTDFTVGFMAKTLAASYPFRVLLVTFALVTVTLAYAYYTVERSYTKMSSYLDAIWLLLASMTTVGYGDVVPQSNPGRVAAILGSIFGVVITSLLVAVLSKKMELTWAQARVDHLLNKDKWRQELKEHAVIALQATWRLWRAKTLRRRKLEKRKREELGKGGDRTRITAPSLAQQQADMEEVATLRRRVHLALSQWRRCKKAISASMTAYLNSRDTVMHEIATFCAEQREFNQELLQRVGNIEIQNSFRTTFESNSNGAGLGHGCTCQRANRHNSDSDSDNGDGDGGDGGGGAGGTVKHPVRDAATVSDRGNNNNNDFDADDGVTDQHGGHRDGSMRRAIRPEQLDTRSHEAHAEDNMYVSNSAAHPGPHDTNAMLCSILEISRGLQDRIADLERQLASQRRRSTSKQVRHSKGSPSIDSPSSHNHGHGTTTHNSNTSNTTTTASSRQAYPSIAQQLSGMALETVERGFRHSPTGAKTENFVSGELYQSPQSLTFS